MEFPMTSEKKSELEKAFEIFSAPGFGESVGTVSQEQPTMQLRWNGDVLEQLWTIEAWNSGKPVNRTHSWRPVPQAEIVTDGGHVVADDENSVTVFVPAEPGEPMFEDKDGNPVYSDDERLRCINQTGLDPAIDDDNGGFL
jgi:hypothetical protein